MTKANPLAARLNCLNMSPLFAVFLLGCASMALCQIPGGFNVQDPQSNSLYLELAHLAVSSQVEGKQYYDTVVELLEVQTQVVAGFNYRLKVLTAPSNCQIGVHQYSKERCTPQSSAPTKVCVAEFFHGLSSEPSLTSYSCDA
ncbi:cystatin-2-like [Ornithodoros turicata]|uniref:cystatin-2-like n=1 Tax=Ornithodoros turicata TaxID=34597 RepID=UPI003139887A